VEIASNSHWIGNSMGPTARLDALNKKKFSCSCQELKHNYNYHNEIQWFFMNLTKQMLNYIQMYKCALLSVTKPVSMTLQNDRIT